MKYMRTVFFILILVLVPVVIATSQVLTPTETLGKMIFFDTTLSTPTGQSCASCHSPETGFTGPSSEVNTTTVVYPGAVDTRFGNRKPPSAAYGGESPVFHYDGKAGHFIGGMFWDGRATGWDLGDPLAEQARGPFLNPVEQNNASKEVVIDKIENSSYASLFEDVYGTDVWNDIEAAYDKAALAVSAYEKSPEVNPFTSKYDYSLKGMVKLTREEKKGLSLFKGKGKCSKCHIVKRGPKGAPPLFTDFTYDNLGIPKNPDNPFYTMPPDINPDSTSWIDPGLGGFLETIGYTEEAEENYGKHKVPTLRNVDRRPSVGFVKAFGHNGFFKSLKSIVHFYNTRDVESWPPPEVAENVNTEELGDLRLTPADEDAIVTFLKTLSDGYVLPGSRIKMRSLQEMGGQGVFQNSPNPFNPETDISFSIPEEGPVDLKIYTALGVEVRSLLDDTRTAGDHLVRWDGRDNSGRSVASGIYYSRLITGEGVQTLKMLLMK